MKEIILKFMPPMQQMVVSDNKEAFRDELYHLEEQLHSIPDYYQSTTVYAHYFLGASDWYVLSWDRENNLLYCYTILNGDVQCADLGDQFLSDLASGYGGIELDFYWEKKPLAEVLYEKYPDYYPEPKKQIP